jgi:hypothetical protein
MVVGVAISLANLPADLVWDSAEPAGSIFIVRHGSGESARLNRRRDRMTEEDLKSDGPAREAATSAQPIEPTPPVESLSDSAEAQGDDRGFVLRTAGHILTILQKKRL